MNKIEIEGNKHITIDFSDIFIYLLMGPLIYSWHLFDRSKVIYMMPLFFFVFYLVGLLVKQGKSYDFIKFDLKGFGLVVIYLIASLVSLSYSDDIVVFDTVYRDVIIFTTPLLLFSNNLKYEHHHVVFLFVIFILSYFAVVGYQINFDILDSIIVTKSNSVNEFHEGVVFGLFFVYFVYKRNILLILVCGFFILLSSKRAIFMGLIPAIGLYFIFISSSKIDKNKHILFILLFIYYFTFYFISFNFVDFSKWVLASFTDGLIDIDNFLRGRDVLSEPLRQKILFKGSGPYFTGYGPGQADIYLQQVLQPILPDWVEGKPVNPHNDFIKLHYDYGIVGVLLYFVILFYLYVRSKVGIFVFLFTIPVFVVDNPVIYVYYYHVACVISNIKVNTNE